MGSWSYSQHGDIQHPIQPIFRHFLQGFWLRIATWVLVEDSNSFYQSWTLTLFIHSWLTVFSLSTHRMALHLKPAILDCLLFIVIWIDIVYMLYSDVNHSEPALEGIGLLINLIITNCNTILEGLSIFSLQAVSDRSRKTPDFKLLKNPLTCLMKNQFFAHC